jgi:hypothetical protein
MGTVNETVVLIRPSKRFTGRTLIYRSIKKWIIKVLVADQQTQHYQLMLSPITGP